MSIFNEADVKIGSFSGRADIEYCESEGRFTFRKTGSVGGRAVAGAMFGALGRAVYEGLASGKEVGNFHISEIRQVRTSESRKKVVYYLYGAMPEPYEISLEKKAKLNAAIQQVFADRMGDVEPKQPVPQPAPQPAPRPAPQPVPEPAPQPVPQPQVPQWRDAVLCLRTGPMAGRSFRCPQGSSITIGRDPNRCNLALSQYPNVSGLHCRLDIRENRILVTDMNSSNGTFVNNVRLTPGQSIMVAPGTAIVLANEICVLQIYFET